MIDPMWNFEAEESETRDRLELRFVECLNKAGEESTSLRQAMLALIEWGVGQRQMVRWAVEVDYGTGYVRSLRSRIFKDLGLHRRKPGAVRKSPREALALRAKRSKASGEEQMRTPPATCCRTPTYCVTQIPFPTSALARNSPVEV